MNCGYDDDVVVVVVVVVDHDDDVSACFTAIDGMIARVVDYVCNVLMILY